MTLQDWLTARFGETDAPEDIYDVESHKDLKFVVNGEIDGYDEGRVDHRYVFQDTQDQKFWEFSYSSDSWSEWSDGLGDIEIFEVTPGEKVVTVYVRV